MEKLFVPYELAVKLKELGFNEECFGYYVDGELDLEWRFADAAQFGHRESVLAPTWDQAFFWFIKNHNLHSYITSTSLGDFAVFITDNYDKHLISNNKLYNNAVHCTYTYEEARQACLEKLIEYIQEELIRTYKY